MNQLVISIFATFVAIASALPAAAVELNPSDLPAVTILKVAEHAPVDIVRDGKAKAVIYLADPKPSADKPPTRNTSRRVRPSQRPRLVAVISDLPFVLFFDSLADALTRRAVVLIPSLTRRASC